MNRIDRIKSMEERLDRAEKAVREAEKALDDYNSALDDIKALAAYYASEQWMRDFDADAAGKLPEDLKRGVLSEDALFDLFAEEREVALACLKAAQRFIEG